MEGRVEGATGQEVWLRGLLRLKDQTTASPRKVKVTLAHKVGNFPGFSTVTCLAMCKRDCLQTQVKLDAPITTAKLSVCDHAHVVLAECEVVPTDFFPDPEPRPYQSTHVVRVSGSTTFLSMYGFFDGEMVWVRPATPLSLKKVILSLPKSIPLTSLVVKSMVEHLYKLSEKSSVIVHRSFKFHNWLPSTSASQAVTQTVGEDYVPSPLSSSSESSIQDGELLAFDVLETAPIIQGAITSKTRIVVVSTEVESPASPSDVHDALMTTVSDDSDLFQPGDSTPSPVRCSSHPRSISLSSASDIRFDDSGQYDPSASAKEDTVLERRATAPAATIFMPLPSIVSPPSSAFILPAVAAHNFKQKYHFILLPKEAALQHRVHDLQIVLIGPEEPPPSFGTSPLGGQWASSLPPSSPVLKLKNIKDSVLAHRHLVVTKCYETALELEQYVPQTTLGKSYTQEELTMAYLHPELLFSLFPETLPLSNGTYRIFVETLKATPSPVVSPAPTDGSSVDYNRHPLNTSGNLNCITEVKPAKKVTVSFISTPDIPPHVSAEEVVYKYLLDTKMMIKAGDVFSVDTTEYGKLFMRMEEVDSSHSLGGTVDRSTRFSLSMRNAHSFRVDLVPHLLSSPTPVSYWEDLRPPGLEHYCSKLFTHFLPSLTPGYHSSAGVLISGPPGVGKKTVVRAVARQCRMNIVEFNCYNFCGDVIASAEKKLKNAFEYAVTCAPCVMLLKEVHVLTRDMESSSPIATQEPRMALAFEMFVSDVAKAVSESDHQYPIIVVGMTTRPGEVPARIQQYFLHEVKITPPSQEQRLKMLRQLLMTTPTSASVDLIDIARRSAGFVLGDLVCLLSKAFHSAYWEMVNHYFKDNSDALHWNQSLDLSVAGVVVTKQHIDSALSTLHSTHSDYLGAPKIPSVQWKDVGGLESAKREILETIQLPLHHPELFSGGLRRSGILLYGAPGTGKTLLAKAVATECSLNFLSVKGPEIINMYVGQSEENIREVFARARAAAPCVIFFDELDSIAPNRGKSGDSGGVMDRVVSQLLAELDGMNRSQDVFIIGATNRPDLIDPALLRPGRFDRLVYLDVSDDVQSRLTILTAITRKFKLEGVDLQSLAERCPSHLTGADLYALCADAMLTSLRRQVAFLEEKGLSDEKWDGQLTVHQEDFDTALKQLRPSIKPEELEKYRSLQQKIAS